MRPLNGWRRASWIQCNDTVVQTVYGMPRLRHCLEFSGVLCCAVPYVLTQGQTW